jgi:hypothetical protein
MRKSAAVVLATLVLILGYSLPSEAHFRGGVWIGPGWGPGVWGAPYYGYGYPYGYPYYSPAPPVVIQQQPQEYVYQPAPQSEQKYWYYCSESKGYYPYVKKCPEGWKKVVPAPAPPATEPADQPDEEE